MKKKATFPYLFTALIAVLGLSLLINHFYRKPRFINGETAPNFTMYLSSGDTIPFHNLKGHFILLDFWGSWCGPCRKESPQLVALHNQYKDAKFQRAKGFKIVSVAVETNRQHWLKAIQKDQLNWPHHSTQLNRFNDPALTLYGVREIPTKYLIDERGTIIGVNLSFPDIQKILDQRQIIN